jgi:hypothetical protein
VSTICRTVVLALLVVVATASPVVADTTVYLMGYAMAVPSPLVLLVSGLALLGAAGVIRKWRS